MKLLNMTNAFDEPKPTNSQIQKFFWQLKTAIRLAALFLLCYRCVNPAMSSLSEKREARAC
jgi:hypothetical protein